MKESSHSNREKASSYLIHHGFKNVNQLDGGVIAYANETKAKGVTSKFKGKNFVFDHRRSERISEDVVSNCHQCGVPADLHTNCVNQSCHLLFIQCDSCKKKMENCCTKECQSVIQLPEEEQKVIRKNTTISNKIFKKGRSENLPFST